MRCLKFVLLLLITAAIVLPCGAVSSGKEFEWEIPEENLLAALMETDIQSIQGAYRAGILTCSQVTAWYLERIETYNGEYNCFISLCDDAMEQAARIDERIAGGDTQGLLLGIPVVIKDNMDYAGYHTTNGYSKSGSRVADENAQIVDYLLQEGAVIIGKTNMSVGAEDPRGSTSYSVGETKNAYNRDLASGGSSGGSAVATALNFAVAGLGTDTNSSLRFPAALNGCVSMRATWNTISMDGIVRLNSKRDVPGAITRSVRDQAIMLDVLSGGKTSYTENLNSNVLKGMRLGVVEELMDRSGQEDEEVMAAFENAVAELEACGAEVITVSVPGVQNWNGLYDNSNYFRSSKIEQLKQIMEENGISAFIFPSYLSTPQYSGRDANGVYWNTYSQSFVNNTSMFASNIGTPEIAVPIGYHSRGAGIGMEIAALNDQEQLLLNIAYSYTQVYDHRQAPENAPDLYAQWYEGSFGELTEQYYRALSEYTLENRPTEEETTAPETEPTETEPAQTFPAPVQTEAPLSGEKASTDLLWPLLIAVPVCGLLTVVWVNRAKKRKRRAAKTQKV